MWQIETLFRQGICERCGGLATHGLDPGVRDRLVLPNAWWTTGCALATIETHVWDVNGFYRGLGVPTDATRKMIGVGYRRVGGWKDSWLTSAVTVLLSSADRAKYDAMVPGEVWLDQRVKAAQERDLARQIEYIMWAADVGADEAVEIISKVDEETVDVPSEKEHDATHPLWGAMLYQTDCLDPALVLAWQRILLPVAAEMLVQTRLALLVSGVATRWSVHPHDGGHVVEVPDGLVPSASVARAMCVAITHPKPSKEVPNVQVC